MLWLLILSKPYNYYNLKIKLCGSKWIRWNFFNANINNNHQQKCVSDEDGRGTIKNVHPLGSLATTSSFVKCFSLYDFAGCT
jgi:hypothetical protein